MCVSGIWRLAYWPAQKIERLAVLRLERQFHDVFCALGRFPRSNPFRAAGAAPPPNWRTADSRIPPRRAIPVEGRQVRRGLRRVPHRATHPGYNRRSSIDRTTAQLCRFRNRPPGSRSAVRRPYRARSLNYGLERPAIGTHGFSTLKNHGNRKARHTIRLAVRTLRRQYRIVWRCPQ